MRFGSPIRFFSAAILAAIFLHSCAEDPPLPPAPPAPPATGLLLSLLDVSDTRARIGLKVFGRDAPHAIVLRRDSVTLFAGKLFRSDTAFLDRYLLPNKRYVYSASLLRDTAVVGRSNELPVFTLPPIPLDTTTHEYEFTLYEVGEINSVFHDVVALSPDFVLAVGHLEPVSGISYTNAYLWNGTQLKPVCLPINPYDTATINPGPEPAVDLRSIWAFRRDNIWYGAGSGALAHLTIAGKDTLVYNLNYLTRSDASPSFRRRIWAKDTSELYFGGLRGTMYRYKDRQWQPMSAQTYGGDVTDLWGFDSDNIWMVSTDDQFFRHTFYQYNGTAWNLLWENGAVSLSDSAYFGAPNSIWGSNDDDSIWVSGLYTGRMKNDGKGKVRIFPETYNVGINRIRGSAGNNIFFVGLGGAILHYNGRTIRSYTSFLHSDIAFQSVSVLDGDVYIVGGRYMGRALFLHGRRVK